MIEVYPSDPNGDLETSSKAHIGGKGVCKVTGTTSAAISALIYRVELGKSGVFLCSKKVFAMEVPNQCSIEERGRGAK